MIEVLKQALDALEKNYKLINGEGTRFGLEGAMDGYYSGCFDVDGTNKETENAITAIKEAIKELESQEPDVVRLSNGTFDVIGSRVVPLGALLYLHPPQRTWVGLTEDDKVLIKHDANFNQFMTAGEYADRVQQLTEARLKDKNT